MLGVCVLLRWCPLQALVVVVRSNGAACDWAYFRPDRVIAQLVLPKVVDQDGESAFVCDHSGPSRKININYMVAVPYFQTRIAPLVGTSPLVQGL